MNAFRLGLWILEVVIMIFALRSLLQTAGAERSLPFAPWVMRVTEPLCRLLRVADLRPGGYACGGLAAGFVIALTAVLVSALLMPELIWLWHRGSAVLPGSAPGLMTVVSFAALTAVLMTVKTLGTLAVILLFVEALTSWLPQTRQISAWCAELTAPIVLPVRRLVPPIGVIDISLMVVLFILLGLNALAAKIFGLLWLVL